MRPRHLALAAALALLAALPPATAAGARHDTAKSIVIRAHSLLLHAQAFTINPRIPEQAGNRIVFTERLLSPQGKAIGHDYADCVRTFDEHSLCTGVYAFRRGQIMVQLLQPSLTAKVTYRQAITGGTGRFTGAYGTVTVHQGAAKSGGDRFTFRIRVPRR